MAAWLQSIWCILCRYPEILLAFACFLFIPTLMKSKKEVPLNWPLVGMLPNLLLNFHRLHDWTAEVLRASGCTFQFHGPWFTHMDLLCTCDPVNVNHIFCTHFSNFPKGSQFSRIFDILGDGIFNSDSDMWQSQRQMAHTLMNGAKFRQFVAKNCFEKVQNGLMPFLEHVATEDVAIDFQDVLKRFTFDITCILVFGTDPSSLSFGFPAVPFSKAMDTAMEVLLFRHVVPESWWMLLRWLKIGGERKLSVAWKTIDEFIYQQISMRKEELHKLKAGVFEKETAQSGDLLTSYIDSQLEDEKGILKSDKFLRDTAMNFMLAGRDTTSAGLTWFFWLVSKNPSVQNKILEELKANWGEKAPPKSTVFETEELSKLVYLHASICESLRLFPPVPFEHKAVLKPQVLPTGETVQLNTKILISLYAMGRMEAVWGDDSLEFKPERWISGKGRLRFEPSHKFMAFNAGPRICLGKDIAFAQMRAVTAAVLYNFHVEVVDGQDARPRNSIILHMRNGLMVRIRKRIL